MTGTPWYRQLSARDWKAFFASWLGYLLDGFDFVLITLVLTDIQSDLGLSAVQAASLVSAAFLSRWIGGIALGAAADRYGRRIAMVASIVLFAVGTAGCGLSWGYTSLFVARLVVGLGMAGEYTASATYIIESWPTGLRNRASGFMLSGYGAGTIIASQVYKYVVPAYGWRVLFWLGLIPVVVALWLRRVLPEAGDWQREVAGRPPARTMVGVLYRGRLAPLNWILTAAVSVALYLLFAGSAGGWKWPLGVLVVAGFVVFLAQFAGGRLATLLAVTVIVFCAFLYTWPIQSMLPTYLKTDLGYSASTVATVLLWAGVGRILGNWLSGFVGDRFGTRAAYAVTLLVSILATLPLLAVGSGTAVLVGAVLFVQQALSQGISGILPKYVTGYLGTGERAAGLGFIYNIGALGGAVAPILAAQISGRISLGSALVLLTVALTAITAALVGLDTPRHVQRLFRGTRRPDLAAEPVD